MGTPEDGRKKREILALGGVSSLEKIQSLRVEKKLSGR